MAVNGLMLPDFVSADETQHGVVADQTGTNNEATATSNPDHANGNGENMDIDVGSSKKQQPPLPPPPLPPAAAITAIGHNPLYKGGADSSKGKKTEAPNKRFQDKRRSIQITFKSRVQHATIIQILKRQHGMKRYNLSRESGMVEYVDNKFARNAIASFQKNKVICSVSWSKYAFDHEGAQKNWTVTQPKRVKGKKPEEDSMRKKKAILSAKEYSSLAASAVSTIFEKAFDIKHK